MKPEYQDPKPNVQKSSNIYFLCLLSNFPLIQARKRSKDDEIYLSDLGLIATGLCGHLSWHHGRPMHCRLPGARPHQVRPPAWPPSPASIHHQYPSVRSGAAHCQHDKYFYIHTKYFYANIIQIFFSPSTLTQIIFNPSSPLIKAIKYQFSSRTKFMHISMS